MQNVASRGENYVARWLCLRIYDILHGYEIDE